MPALTIRQLSDETKRRLRLRAAAHDRSMEEEAREILRTALATGPDQPVNLAEAVMSRFGPLGGVEIELPPREASREPPDFR